MKHICMQHNYVHITYVHVIYVHVTSCYYQMLRLKMIFSYTALLNFVCNDFHVMYIECIMYKA